MAKRLLRLTALWLMAFLVFAPAGWAQGQEVTVRMEDNFFAPADITVEPGTTVTWVQSGNNGHTTTSYDGLWDSGMIAGGSDGSFSFTFDEPGTFDYYCIPHEQLGMVGTVTVASTASPTATALADTGGPPAPLLVTLAATVALLVSGFAALVLRGRSAG